MLAAAESLPTAALRPMQASATLELHESASCSLLLPCGLLPEELEELESIGSPRSSLKGGPFEGCRCGRQLRLPAAPEAAGAQAPKPQQPPCSRPAPHL